MSWITDQLRGSIKTREHLHFPVQNGVMWRNTWRFHRRLMTADHSWWRVSGGSLLHVFVFLFFLICADDWHFSRSVIGAGGRTGARGAEMTSILVLVNASNETLQGVKIDPRYLYWKYLRARPAWQFPSNFLTFHEHGTTWINDGKRGLKRKTITRCAETQSKVDVLYLFRN